VASTRTSGFALSLGAFPEASVHSFYAHTNGVSAASLRAKLAEQRAYDSWSVIVLIVIGRGRFDLILDELQSASPNAAIIGGVATGRWLLHAHAHTATFISSGVVGLCFGGNVPLKALVCNRQAAPRLKAARTELIDQQQQQLLGALMFTCTARDEAADALDFAAAFPHTSIVGMPAGGEIGPSARRLSGGCEGATQTGCAQMQGFTAVYGLFAVPCKQRAPVDIGYADVDVAWAEARLAELAALRSPSAQQRAEKRTLRNALRKGQGARKDAGAD